MLILRKNGATSNVFRVMLRNSSTGQGLTGLTSASSGLVISTIADNESSTTDYTAAGSTIETITTLGTYSAPTATKCRFKEVSSSSQPGLYELQFADARFAVSSAKTLRITISGATSLMMKAVVIQLTSVDLDDAVRGGMTAMPNANAGASGGLPINGANAGNVSYSGTVTYSTTVTYGGNVAISGTLSIDTLSSPDPSGVTTLLGRVSATRAGYLDNLSGGAVALAGTALSTAQWTNTRAGNLDNLDAAVTTRMATYTQPTGFLAATFPAGTVASTTNITAGTITTVTNLTTYTGNTPQTGDAYARLGAPAGASVSADVAAVKSDTGGLVTTLGSAGAGLTGVPRTGYKLASDGLDSVSTTAPAGVASNYREMQVQTWRRAMKKTVFDTNANTLKTFADDGTTVLTTQTLTNSGGVQTQGAAS
jgi:hypothetical protein